MMKHYHTLWHFFVVVISLHKTLTLALSSNKTVLVFGGNGYIGTEVVHHLLQHDYKPILVSRGKWRFDAETLIKPHVLHIPCDRYKNVSSSPEPNPLKHCPELLELIENKDQFDFVIDFTAHCSEEVEHVAEILKGKIGLYIYISSDSVYEVCRKPKKLPIKETECVRPKNEKIRRRLAKKDEHGDGKLQGEEYLMKQRKEDGFPFLILRLPDAIGPRDNSLRWWPLQIWVQYYHKIEKPIVIDESHGDFESSLVFTKDVARVIRYAMESGSIAHDQVYNVAFNQSFHYKEIVHSIARELKIHGIKFSDQEHGLQMYPSVSRGPVDISKVQQDLGFIPTPWKDAVKSTVSWYEKANLIYATELNTMLHHCFDKIIPEDTVDAFMEAFMWRDRDEL